MYDMYVYIYTGNFCRSPVDDSLHLPVDTNHLKSVCNHHDSATPTPSIWFHPGVFRWFLTNFTWPDHGGGFRALPAVSWCFTSRFALVCMENALKVLNHWNYMFALMYCVCNLYKLIYIFFVCIYTIVYIYLYIYTVCWYYGKYGVWYTTKSVCLGQWCPFISLLLV